MEENRYLKKYGQNFLNNDYIATTIVDSLSFNGQKIMEIGPGDGALTDKLINKNCDLTCVEIDEFYFKKLKERHPDLNVINTNVLKADFSSYESIIGNIPYNITSSLLVKIATNAKKVKEVVFMIQKDAYERIIECKTKGERSSVSNLIATRFDYKKIIDVSKNNFVPKPNVDSTVFKLIAKENVDIDDFRSYYEYLLLIFNAKRKTILNNLGSKYNKMILREIFDRLNLLPTLRAEDLSIEQHIKLYNILNDKGE